MVLKNVGIAIICTTLLAWSSPSLADEYRPGKDFLAIVALDAQPLGLGIATIL